MYLAVHLVRRGGDEGINAFLHEHPADLSWPENSAGLPDTNPGTVIDSRIKLTPGGNEVRAYLDILAPNGTSPAKMSAALAALRRDLDERRNPTIFVLGDVTIRYGVELGLEKMREEQLETLARVGLDLLRQQ
jgi:hypothetical protein